MMVTGAWAGPFVMAGSTVRALWAGHVTGMRLASSSVRM